MMLRSILLLAVLGTRGLGAATIVDVSGQGTLALKTGDTLVFEIRSGSFSKSALSFGLPLYPTEVSFALVSGPLWGAGTFSASLGPADGETPVEFGGPLEFHDGTFSAAGSRGAVSTLQGYLQLSPQLSRQVFSGGTAILRLRNNGPALQLGLDSYTIGQDLFVSLAGGPMSVGGIVEDVELEPATLHPAALGNGVKFEEDGASAGLDSLSVAPEPNSSGLFLAGGTLLCGLSVTIARISKGRKQGEKSTVCNRPSHSDTIYMADRNPPLEVPQIQPRSIKN